MSNGLVNTFRRNDIRAIARQPPISIQKLLEVVFSAESAPRLYSEDRKPAEAVQGSSASPCGHGVEYLHRSPASRSRRRKGNPVPGVIPGPPCSWGYKYMNLALQIRGSLQSETVNCDHVSLGTRTWNCKRQTHPLVREDVT
jgi:hypothetical protein